MNQKENLKLIRVAIVGDNGISIEPLRNAILASLPNDSSEYQFEWMEVENLEALSEMRPDVVLNVVNAVDIEYSLLTTARLVERHLKVVMALNHYDELLASDHTLDYETLGQLMGFKVIPTDAHTGRGIQALIKSIVNAHENREDAVKHVHVTYNPDIEKAIRNIVAEIHRCPDCGRIHSKRHVAIQLLEDPHSNMHYFKQESNYFRLLEVVEENRRKLLREFHEDPAILIQKSKNGFVAGALNATLRHSENDTDHTLTQKIDAILTNRWLGFPILVVVLFLMFQSTFALGAYPQAWIANGISALCGWLETVFAEGWLSSMLIDGVVQGVGAVLSFLPNIVIMFFFLTMLEDCGYMSRAAFLMDKIMHRIGLHGRSFVPMLIGFGCNVPAIMAARNIDNFKDRALTILMIPFMSCSARLPVYLLLVSAFFDLKYRAFIIMGLYLIGIVLSIIYALILKRTRWFRQKNDDFVSELPPYRKPTFRNTGAHIWERTLDYLQKIATVILWTSVIIWALQYFPRNKELIQPIEQQIVAVQQNDTLTREEQALQIAQLNQQAVYVQNEHSYLASIGRFVEPVLRPLGFDWRIGVCLLTGLPAKEAIVSTIGILYHVDSDDDASVVSALRNSPNFNPVIAIAFMLFVMLYFPCIATMATMRREIGTKWTTFSLASSMVLAWLVAFIVFQLGSLLL